MRRGKQILKRMIAYLCYGISWGCTCLVLVCLIYKALGVEEGLALIYADFTKHAIGSVLVGIACGSTSIVYQFERPSLVVKVAIHFVVGMGVLYPVAFYLGWIPFYPDHPLYTLAQFFISCVIFIAIWCCFYFFHRGEAKRINDRLRELERMEEDL